MSWVGVLPILLTAAPAVCAGHALANDFAPSPEIGLNRAWAESAFSQAPGPAVGHRLTLVHEDEPGDTTVNACAYATHPPIRLGERTYARGIGVNSTSTLRVSLARPAARFVADIGLDRNVDGTAASVRFHVSVDGHDVFATDIVRPGDPAQSIDVALDGAQEFDLTVDDGGDGRGWDQGDWADARVVLEDGEVLWLDGLAQASALSAALPFSFVYDGRPSQDFLAGWDASVVEEATDATTIRRALLLIDPVTSLEVRADCIIYTDTPGVEWRLRFSNWGDADTPTIEQIRILDTTVDLGFGGAPTLHRLRGSSFSVEDWLPTEDAVARGERIDFAPIGGKSSQGASPFFSVNWQGGGLVYGLGWSGQWAASVENGEDGLRLAAGIENARLKLRPGESVRGPRVLQVQWEARDGDPWHPYNLFRRAMLSHVVPRIDGEPVTPPIVHLSTSFYELNDSTEANVLSHLEAIKGLGFEFFWLDAYWTRDGFPNGMGHYGFPLDRAEPPDRFPAGLRPIGRAAHEEGMGFVVWFEPERVAAGTALAREHPEWVISPGGDGSGLLNLGDPAAREYMTKYLIAAIRRYKIDCLRIDFNINPLPFWRHLDAADPDRVGMGEIRYVEGLYRMWDDILAAFPHLFIDNCASGGMRIDLETCARSIPLWRTDATIPPLMEMDLDQAALQNQAITAGLGRYVPFSTSGMMGATRYEFRSGFNAGISFCEDCRPEDYPREALASAISEGKRLRPYFMGDLYVLSAVTVDPQGWCVLQYHRPAEGDGMIIAFRRDASPYASFDCRPFAIDEDAEYEVIVSGEDGVPTPARREGEDLRRLRLEIDEAPGSVVVEYRRVSH